MTGKPRPHARTPSSSVSSLSGTQGDIDQMDRAASQLLSMTDQHSTAVIFYSGYGIQVVEDGEPSNYLVAKDDVFRSTADIQRKAFPLTRFLLKMEKRNPLLTVVALDACRHRPVPAGVVRGLAPPAGTGR